MNWKSETRHIDELRPAQYNPRKLTKKQKADLQESLDKFELVDPIIINTTGTIIGGHQRYQLLKEKGVTEIDVRVPERELNMDEEKELNLRLNKNTGEFDLGLLTSFDPNMLTMVGFEGDFVDDLFKAESSEDQFDEKEEYEKIETPKTKIGDLYLFDGGHRLLCGSSSEFADVEKLMDNAKADLIYTDPPYNVNYKSTGGSGSVAGKSKQTKILNDNLNDDDFVAWLTSVFLNAYAVSHEHANVYSWFGMKNYSLFRQSLEAAGFRYMQVIYWMKERFVLSRGWYFHRIMEPCMICYRDWNKKFVNMHYAKNHDIWSVDRMTFEEQMDVIYAHRDQTSEYQHPTQKPIRLHERAMKRNSESGQIVLELFAGGGSTLLCAHQLGRRCYAMELDPKYCDVIVKRFTLMTGKEPRRVV